MQLPIEDILEGFPDGAAAIGPDAQLLHVNSRLSKDVGPWAGKSCYETLAGLKTFCPFCPFEKLVDGSAGPEIRAVQVRYDKKCAVKVRFIQQNDVGFILESVTDLTEQEKSKQLYDKISNLETELTQSRELFKKQAEVLEEEVKRRTAALEKETGYLEGILRYSEDMIITTDLESRIVKFNPCAERMLGYTAQELQGRDVSELWVEAPERQKILDEVNASGGVRNYETRLKSKAGGIVEISLTLSLLRDQQGRLLGTVGVSKDIGREKAFRRELDLVNQNFREAVHFINHETKNSLIVMGGFLQRLLNTERDAARKEQLQIVYHHSQFLEAMSRDFLVMAELEHGEFKIRKQLIRNFNEEVIQPAMTGLKERYPDSFASYDISMGGVGAIQLKGDPALLEIVYRNLFGNALKYCHPGGKLAYGFEDQGDSFLFNVWNAGPGVAPHLVDKIFDKFYRVRDDATKGKRGTGLGLYNVRKIIEAHGGRIWCETKPGEWINFLFVLPKE
ncbi:MAG TPA: ATP-binding protein [Desulfomonilaceae bacterium]|nr:ATP-binding protein [Desulfomonilaceae bacterium]